jgi:mRNA-degrading endonuclease YafQ of YafQ-DinJ toxin-antitoxin module
MPKKKKKDKKPFFVEKKKGNIITIKTSLKFILKDYETNFRKMNELVIECNDIIIQTYQFIRLYILHCYYQKKEFLELNEKTIKYFIRAGGIRDNRGIQPNNKELEKELDEFYENEFRPLIKKEKYNLKNKSYLIPYLAIQINTSFHNNIKEHFITRIRRFMNITSIFQQETKEQKKEFNKVKNLILLDKIEEIPELYQEWSKNIRNHFLPQTYEKVFGYDCHVNPNKYLFYTIKMNEEIEKRNEEIRNSNKSQEEKRKQIKKLFQPVPLRNTIIPHYITLDANSILSLFGEKGESDLGYKIKENKDKIWSKIFGTESKVMKLKGYEFNSIQTDGIGVSICFQKIGITKKEKKEVINDNEHYLTELTDEELEKCKKRKIIGIDIKIFLWKILICGNFFIKNYRTQENKV